MIKMVNVYMGYCEMSLNDKEILFNNREECDEWIKNEWERMRNEDDMCDEDIGEFCGDKVEWKKNNLGIVMWGEENMLLFVDEKNEWFNELVVDDKGFSEFNGDEKKWRKTLGRYW